MNTLISGVNSERWRSRVEAQHVPSHDIVDYVPHSEHGDLEFGLGLYIWALLSGYCCPCWVESPVEKLHPPKKKIESNLKLICSLFPFPGIELLKFSEFPK